MKSLLVKSLRLSSKELSKRLLMITVAHLLFIATEISLYHLAPSFSEENPF